MFVCDAADSIREINHIRNEPSRCKNGGDFLHLSYTTLEKCHHHNRIKNRIKNADHPSTQIKRKCTRSCFLNAKTIACLISTTCATNVNCKHFCARRHQYLLDRTAELQGQLASSVRGGCDDLDRMLRLSRIKVMTNQRLQIPGIDNTFVVVNTFCMVPKQLKHVWLSPEVLQTLVCLSRNQHDEQN